MKRDRQKRILELIEERTVETQEELAEGLRREGFRVTQATVSRDIRELELVKTSAGGGRQKYMAPVLQQDAPVSVQTGERYDRVLKEGFTSMDMAQNLVVIRTVSGMAMAVAAALDAMKFPEVLGCIAGDDTIMVASRSNAEAQALIRKIKEKLDR